MRPVIIFLFLAVLSVQASAQNISTAVNGLRKPTTTSVGLGGTLSNAQTVIDFGSANASASILFRKGTANYFLIDNLGNIGINTITPGNKLTVNSGTAGTSGIRLVQMNSTSPAVAYTGKMLSVNAAGDIILTQAEINLATETAGLLPLSKGGTGLAITGSAYQQLRVNASGTALEYFTPAANASGWLPTGNNLVNTNSGFVGVGTDASPNAADPTVKMAVKGTLYAQKVKVTQLGWADYVFEKDYELRPLTSLKDFIQTHKHLPDVPSAAEVEKNGVDLGDNQAVLLRKIEELTLYILAQEEKLEQLRSDLDQFRKNKK